MIVMDYFKPGARGLTRLGHGTVLAQPPTTEDGRSWHTIASPDPEEWLFRWEPAPPVGYSSSLGACEEAD